MFRKPRLLKRVAILLIVNFGIILVFFSMSNLQEEDLTQLKKVTRLTAARVKPLKEILYWNSYYVFPYINFGHGREPFIVEQCWETRCFITDRKRMGTMAVEDFDAVLFHGYDVHKFQDYPEIRNPHQRYVFYILEQPNVILENLKRAPRGFYNWTMNYRLDSDIVHLYGFVKTLSRPEQYLLPPFVDWITIPEDFSSGHLPTITRKTLLKKKNMVAWFVNHCETPGKREDYVTELQKHVKVDIYGNCGGHVCPYCPDEKCYELLKDKYKFYLSFENTICRDYVSEKFFHALQYDVVPIVYGGANYSVRAPPGSYIDVTDFDSPRHLAEYLRYLDSNYQEYLKFFWWKIHYQALSLSKYHLCQLCSKLHDEDEPPKTYHSIYDWYMSPEICQDQEHYLKSDKIGLSPSNLES